MGRKVLHWTSLPLLLLLLSGLSNGCNLLAQPASTATSTSVPPPTSTDTMTPAVPTTSTQTPVSSPTLTATSTWTPTETPSDTATATPVPPTDTPAFTATPLPPTVTHTPTPAPTETPIPPTITPTTLVVNWRGEYYANRNLMGNPALVRNDPAINFDWDHASPAGSVPADDFSVRWTRTLQFEEGTYRFHTAVDDGARLYVDGALLIDEWEDGSQREVTGEQALTTGDHSLRIEYYERAGNALIRVWWEKIGPPATRWRGEYWPNRWLYGEPEVVRNDPAIDFDWGSGSPDDRLPNDGFSARWTRTASFAEGVYRLHMIVDDGAALWVDDRMTINEWQSGEEREATAELALGQGKHSLRLEYFEQVGEAVIRVWWVKIAGDPIPR